MGILRFKDHPIVKEFNGLKKFFRSQETTVSRQRIKDLKEFVLQVQKTGEDIAFDVLGSVNFGQATENSDIDIVIYLQCDKDNIGSCDHENCSKLPVYIDLLKNHLVFSHFSNSYPLQIVDCINLNQIEYDLKIRNFDSFGLVKFGFYRSICRGINRKLLYKYEVKLQSDEKLCRVIEKNISDLFLGLIHSNSHTYSFHKYIDRLQSSGFKIPQQIIEKINHYINQ